MENRLASRRSTALSCAQAAAGASATISHCPHLSHLTWLVTVIDLKVSKAQTLSLCRGNATAEAASVAAFLESSLLLVPETKHQE